MALRYLNWQKTTKFWSSVANILTRSAEYQDDYSSNVNKGIKGKLKIESGKHVDEVLFK